MADEQSELTLRILIVEDNRGDVLLVREALKESGVNFELSHALDGSEALNYLRKCSDSKGAFDLVLLDLNLPKHDGWEVLKEMRSLAGEVREVPVAILSSSASPDDIKRAESLGVWKYIRKPSNLEEFLAIGQTIKGLRPSARV